MSFFEQAFVQGTLTHNNAAPTSNNVGALVAVASSGAPTYTAGDQVLLSVDTSGNLRVTFAGGTIPVTQSGTWNVGLMAGAQVEITDGTNVLFTSGHPGFVQGTVAVTQSTSPWVVSLASTTITGTVAVTQSTSPWVVSGSLTVSGSVTANQGSAAALAGAWPVEITDGTNVLGTPSNPVRIDPTGTTTQPVSGTVAVTQSTSPWVTSDNHLPAAVALSDSLSNPTTTEIGANLLGWDATNTVWRRVQVDAGTGTVKVDPGTVSVVGPTSTTANSPASTAVTSSSSTVLAANASRKELTIVNTGVVTVYLALGQTPTSSAYHIALPGCGSANDGTGGTYTTDLWKGLINAITASTSGTIVITELT